MTTPPPDTRPYRLPSASGPERATTTISEGWLGQSGAFYSLDEDPKPHEPGSYSPLWILADDDLIPEDEWDATRPRS